MPWVLLMNVQGIQSLKGNQQAWQFRLWAYCGIFGEWRNLSWNTVVVVATPIDIQNQTIWSYMYSYKILARRKIIIS